MGDEKLSLINENYGAQFKEHLLEQYKLYVDSSKEISARRHNSNTFYLAINSALFGLSSYLSTINVKFVTLIICLTGVLISYFWRKNIHAYKQLNVAKFKVIHELEKQLPATLFEKEDEHLGKGGYYELTSVEKNIPLVFIVLFILIIGLIGFQEILS